MSTSLPMPQLPRTDEGRRFCQVVKIRPEHLEEYKRVHDEIWPEITAALRKANIVDYSIHHIAPLNLLVANMKYIGSPAEYKKKMTEMAENEVVQKWWKMTDGMQESLVEGATGSTDPKGWWTPGQEVFRMEG